MRKFWKYVFYKEPNAITVMWVFAGLILLVVGIMFLSVLSLWYIFGLIVLIFVTTTIMIYKDMNEDGDE